MIIKAELSSMPRLEELAYSGELITFDPKREGSLINAQNDAQAVQIWLNEYKSPATIRSYRKEAERFLLWCLSVAHKNFRELTREDFDTYAAFLDDPLPRHIWCGIKGGRSNKRGQAGWRPFVGPLNQAAKITALTIIKSLFNYLVDARYLPANPLGLMKKVKQPNMSTARQISIHERILADDEWTAIIDTLHTLPSTTPLEQAEKERLIFIIAMLYFLGLRVTELVNHTWRAFKKIDDCWWFFVLGKGQKLGKIPVNDVLLEAVIRYRTFLGKTVYPEEGENGPLICSVRARRAISSRQVSFLIKKLAIKAAKQFPDSIEKQKKLQKVSPHWLRHLSASMQDRVGIPFTHIRENHRHTKDDTTRIYIHANDKQRHRSLNKLNWIPNTEDITN